MPFLAYVVPTSRRGAMKVELSWLLSFSLKSCWRQSASSLFNHAFFSAKHVLPYSDNPCGSRNTLFLIGNEPKGTTKEEKSVPIGTLFRQEFALSDTISSAWYYLNSQVRITLMNNKFATRFALTALLSLSACLSLHAQADVAPASTMTFSIPDELTIHKTLPYLKVGMTLADPAGLVSCSISGGSAGGAASSKGNHAREQLFVFLLQLLPHGRLPVQGNRDQC